VPLIGSWMTDINLIYPYSEIRELRRKTWSYS
jgi:hypothetical protein